MVRIPLVLALMVGGAAPTAAQVGGRVRYEGPPPKLEVLDLRSDPVCVAKAGHATANHTLVGPQGGLANVFVHVDNPPPGEHPGAALPPVVLDQRACRYHPKVFGILVGQRLEIHNSDPTVHTVHAYVFRGFNAVTPREGQRVTKTFKRPKLMAPLRCDVHPWMNAYAGVTRHPFFAVTDTHGRFQLPVGLPDGQYALTLWHEKLGRRRATLQVREGRGRVEVVFSPAQPRPR